MSVDIEAREIIRLVNEARTQNDKKRIYSILDQIDKANERIFPYFNQAPSPTRTQEIIPISPNKRISISKSEKKILLKQINANVDTLKRLNKKKNKKQVEEVEFTVYKTPFYGKIANTFFKSISNNIVRNNKPFFRNLYNTIRASDIKILTQTYISVILFSTLLGFMLLFSAALALYYFINIPIFFGILTSIFLSVIIFALIYLYPSLVVNKRKRMIKNDLPFAIIHMATVAGSGAQPISIFKLLLANPEYPGLENEIKKIVNYVNLFGYDLSTALKTVASTTPSDKFKDLLNGIASTIESGGSLKSYLHDVAQDTMSTYKLERKKYVESLSTYSDIYTGILIAAPLLFIVTLAIINIIGGDIGGLSASSLALFGTYIIIPVLNVLFILFLNVMQPEV